MYKVICVALFSLLCTQVMAQSYTEGVFQQDGTHSGKYAAYLPSSFKKGKALPVVIAFHPLNSLKWDEQRWRNELSSFAEKNQVLLICPESNLKLSYGKVAYLDFVKEMTLKLLGKYDVQPNCIYLMGAGMGANSALSMGARHRNFINGLILVGSNSRIANLLPGDYARLFNLPVYIIHGKKDQLRQKYYPLRESLSEAGACLSTCLVENQGNPSIIPFKKDYLSKAFNWVHNYSCNKPESVWSENRHVQALRRSNRPNLAVEGNNIILSNIHPTHAVKSINVYNTKGILVGVVRNPAVNEVIKLPSNGDYTITLHSPLRALHFKVEIGQGKKSR